MANPRAEFSPIFHRPPLKLPNNARVAVWPVINVEEWDINEPMARTVLPTPQGVTTIPDIPNFGWFDYGLRVGFWRFKQVLDKYGVRATVSLNASVCRGYPMLVEECTKSGWEMLAHVHSQVWNASRFANSLDTSAPTVRRHLDLLTDLLLVRQLQPLHANLKKRLVKSPKVYLRDSGLLHALLLLTDPESIYSHPCLGASFEGFAIENIISLLPPFADVTFYRSHTGDEIDLVVSLPGGRRIAVDVKYTASPRVSKAFRTAMTDLDIAQGYIVTAGEAAFPLDESIEAVPLHLIEDHIGSW